MLWKILLLAACALAVWGITRPSPPTRPTHPSRPKNKARKEDDKTQNLALCQKCGVYHHPDAPCQNPNSSAKPS